MKKPLIALSLALLTAVAWALPSVADVEAQVQQGHYTQAESMMKEVVDAKPASAKGHYVYAELLAHNGNFARASEEAAKARQLDPEIKFASPEKFRAFEELLKREQSPRPRAETSSPTSSLSQLAPAAVEAPRPAASGLPSWVWGAGLAVIAFLLWRGFSRSRGASAPATTSAASNYGSPMGGNAYATPGTPMNPYGGAPAAPAAGGGLLRTGAAVAGGVAAGMLVDELLHRRGGGGNDTLSGLQSGSLFNNPLPDNSAANELENRNIDFGNGGDWDAGGGSDSGGSSGDDSGGGWD